MLCYLSSYFASISLHKNFHDPRTILSGRIVCVGGGRLRRLYTFEGKFSVSFGPKPGFRLWIWTKLNNYAIVILFHRATLSNDMSLKFIQNRSGL